MMTREDRLYRLGILLWSTGLFVMGTTGLVSGSWIGLGIGLVLVVVGLAVMGWLL